MKFRATTALLCVICFCTAMLVGVSHHDHPHCDEAASAQKDCPACVWKLGAIADVPALFVVSAGEVVESLLPACQSESPCATFFLPAASRAPPSAPA